MDHATYVKWSAQQDQLTESQRRDMLKQLRRSAAASASVALVEQGVGEDRRCRHCHAPGAVRNGHSRGLQRYRCKSCGRTFNAVTNTPLSGLHRKDRWLAAGRSLARQESVRVMAKRCGVDPTTAFRWRHRFLRAVGEAPDRLGGIVEVDETYVRTSEKGSKCLPRKPRRRGAPAVRPGRAKEGHVPVLVAADRGGATCSQVLPDLSAESLADGLRHRVQPDALLVSDGYRSYPPCAATLGLRHHGVNVSAGGRVQGPYHIQTANNRHQQLKDFLRPFRGVATRYLDNYLHFFHLKALADHPTPRTCLATAISRSSIRFAN